MTGSGGVGSRDAAVKPLWMDSRRLPLPVTRPRETESLRENGISLRENGITPMSVKKRGLGRGLDALLGGMRDDLVSAVEVEEAESGAAWLTSSWGRASS